MTLMKTNNDPAFGDDSFVWEVWMVFDGVTCNQAFDEGFDFPVTGRRCCYIHPALIAAFQSGIDQFWLENN